MDIMKEIIRWQSGNYDAFNKIYTRYYERIYWLCFNILKVEEDAMDATQETFIEVLKGIDNLRNVKAFYSWIRKIAVCICNKIIIKNKKVLIINDEDFKLYKDSEEQRPEVIVLKSENRDLMLSSINRLKAKKRDVILLYYYKDLDIQTISEVLNCPVGTVKSRLNSARNDLKNYYKAI